MELKLEDRVKEFGAKYYPKMDLTNEILFTAMCIKYYFFEETFAPDEMLFSIVDGPNDGGIDAIFTDPFSENNDLIIVQSKYYNSTKLSIKEIESEVHKIQKTLKDLSSRNTNPYKKELTRTYLDCLEIMSEGAQVKIYIFTSSEAKDKNTRSNYLFELKKLEQGNQVIDIYFNKDIEEQIMLSENGQYSVSKGKVSIDKVDNFLEYGDSVVVNVSAISINELYKKFANRGLLASNLRYYIKDKKVDKGINKTIEQEPENFWFYNNGIIIVANDYEISSKDIFLYDFSIVNGGQTTALIGQINFSQHNDFFIQVKIIKIIGDTEKKQEKFVLSVAEASNSQKAIKEKDLIANKMEQLRLKNGLSKHRIYYVLKRGEVIDKKYSGFIRTNSDLVGKLIMSSVLQMPGTARSGTKRIYSDDYYRRIFPDEPRTELAKQLIFISEYYTKYRKEKNVSSEDKIAILANGQMHFIAIFTLLIAASRELINYAHYSRIPIEGKKEELYNKLKRMDKIYEKSLDNEYDTTKKVFDIILDDILYNSYRIEKKSKENIGESINVTNYLKLESTYFHDIVPRALEIFSEHDTLSKTLMEFNVF